MEEVRYVMGLTTSGGDVRIPIRSWQATLSLLSSGYVQCVIGAPDEWTDDIADATDVTISYRAPGGSETEIITSEIEQASLSQGADNVSVVVSGRPGQVTDPGTPIYEVTLTKVRVLFDNGNTVRLRCPMDISIEPGFRIIFGAYDFKATYVNFYAPDGDSYMDIGGDL